ncbi:hypothetical protein OCGS_1400 [Oceaniovalibus guishaninsula JLT2003]|uniref:Carboxymuconolactone decarboxylase-like domain-containing protein n=1 Tax=Oceaniovalibus guishaninsula JLT2003 TaxID=1231392 RepID=K2HDD7_9RHOB|nr:carboxymuconolactone decarboxylase family protein [Oceaniovalibus guishaninsula]EKE44562.1 hypothetical protein OCGS_1400 [Oceaniovalibus guishaninsula JLT2003]
MTDQLPGAAGTIADKHPDVWAAYSALGKATANAGGLTAREKRLVKLALSLGAASEGAVHSHTRRALKEGIAVADLEQVALLGIGPLGFPQAVAGYTWIGDSTSAD